MEERSNKLMHHVAMNNREEITLTGVEDVISFDETFAAVETEMGILELKGVDLHVSQLNLDVGELMMTGLIQSLEYIEQRSFEKSRESFINRLFS